MITIKEMKTKQELTQFVKILNTKQTLNQPCDLITLISVKQYDLKNIFCQSSDEISIQNMIYF